MIVSYISYVDHQNVYNRIPISWIPSGHFMKYDFTDLLFPKQKKLK